jgi:hypothetical protein
MRGNWGNAEISRRKNLINLKIAQHACEKYSGRVGRSAAAREFDPQAVTFAVRAHVRHQHTNYDELLFGGYDRHNARAMVEECVCFCF